MPQNLVVQNKGLATNPSPMIASDGTLAEAVNVVLDRPGVLSPRRGFKRYGDDLGGEPGKLINYRDRIIVQQGTDLWYDSDGAGNFTQYSGTFDEAGAFLRSAELGGSLYLTTTTGLRKIATLTSTPETAGIPKGLNGTTALNAAAGGFLLNGNRTSYRVVWGKIDDNGKTILGEPSDRMFTPGTVADKNIDLVFPVPSGIGTSHFWQLYRSPQVLTAVEPSDEMYLVAQAYYVSGTSVSYTDNTPELLRGPQLYTNQSQDGIAQANSLPPYAKDVASWKNHLFLADTKQFHYMILRLIGTSMAVGSEVTFTDGTNSFTLACDAVEDIPNGHFVMSAAPDILDAIRETADSFVRALNGYTSNTFLYAYRYSGYTTEPGRIRVQARAFSTPEFSVTADAGGDIFAPQIPTSGTSVHSVNDEAPNRLHISKYLQGDAFPIAQYLDIGNAQHAIMRIVPMRDSLYIFKQDGLYRLVGETTDDFRVLVHDPSIVLRGNDTPATFDNTLYCLSNKGIAVITDSSVVTASEAIDDQILELQASTDPDLELSFGVGYESDQKYILFVPMNSVAFVFHSDTAQFTTWDIVANSGIVNSADGKLYLSYDGENFVRQERKSFTFDDNADHSFAVTVNSFTSTTVTLASATGVVVGNVISQGYNRSIITEINTNTLTVEDADIPWVTGDATISEPITWRVLYNPVTYGNPVKMKQAYSFEALFTRADFIRMTLGFVTDFSPGEESVEMQPLFSSGWGDSPWGDDPWGGESKDSAFRTWVPREKQWHHWIQPSFGNTDSFSDLALLGFSIHFEEISEDIK